MEFAISTDGAESEVDTCPIVNDTIETSIRKLANESDSAAVLPATTTVADKQTHPI